MGRLFRLRNCIVLISLLIANVSAVPTLPFFGVGENLEAGGGADVSAAGSLQAGVGDVGFDVSGSKSLSLGEHIGVDENANPNVISFDTPIHTEKIHHVVPIQEVRPLPPRPLPIQRPPQPPPHLVQPPCDHHVPGPGPNRQHGGPTNYHLRSLPSNKHNATDSKNNTKHDAVQVARNLRHIIHSSQNKTEHHPTDNNKNNTEQHEEMRIARSISHHATNISKTSHNNKSEHEPEILYVVGSVSPPEGRAHLELRASPPNEIKFEKPDLHHPHPLSNSTLKENKTSQEHPNDANLHVQEGKITLRSSNESLVLIPNKNTTENKNSTTDRPVSPRLSGMNKLYRMFGSH